MLRSLTFLLCLQAVGEAIALFSRAQMPGRIIGMLLLFVLMLRWPRLEALALPMGKALLSILPLLFVPVAVGVITYGETLRGEGLAIGIALLASAVSGLVVTAVVARGLMMASRKRDICSSVVSSK